MNASEADAICNGPGLLYSQSDTTLLAVLTDHIGPDLECRIARRILSSSVLRPPSW